MIWVEMGSGVRPKAAQTWASTAGSMLAKVPTAPEMAPVAIFGARGAQAGEVAVHFRIKAGEGQTEGGGLGVDGVGTADAQCVFVLVCAAF